LFKYFPNIKFIHIIRDVRDTACSLRTHPKRIIKNGKEISLNTNNPFDWCIRRWLLCINKGKKRKNTNNYMELKYEDLLKNPEFEMKKIFKFLDLKMISNKTLLDFNKKQNNLNHPQNIEVGKPIYKTKMKRWKRDMTDKEKELFKKMAGDLLIEVGYGKNNNW
jgi:hypothetical protein